MLHNQLSCTYEYLVRISMVIFHARRMAQQALHSAQARLDQLQRQCDEAFTAYEANPSNDLKKERYQELNSSLRKTEDVVKSLAMAAGSASTSGWQVYCALYLPGCTFLCYLQLLPSPQGVHLASFCLCYRALCDTRRSYHHVPFSLAVRTLQCKGLHSFAAIPNSRHEGLKPVRG